ncbi:hypothetical protein [Cupriavidus necator]
MLDRLHARGLVENPATKANAKGYSRSISLSRIRRARTGRDSNVRR